MEAQKITVRLELHNIPAANAIEKTTVKIVKLKIRIALAEDVLGRQIQDMQNMNALFQLGGPIAKHHTSTSQVADFNKFYSMVIKLWTDDKTQCKLDQREGVVLPRYWRT